MPLDYYTRFASEIERVTPNQVLEASRLILPDGLLVVLVGDQKQFLPELTQAGFQAEPAPPQLSE